MESYKAKFHEANNYRYYLSELSKAFPADEYGARIQVESSKGRSKWLNLNTDCAKALQEIVKKYIK